MNEKKTGPEKWHLARTWVNSHPVLIRCIAAPYYRHMRCDPADLQGEALLTAYQVVCLLMERRQDLALMDRYFRVAFRTRCIELTVRVNLADCDLDRIPAPSPPDGSPQEQEQERVRRVLRQTTLTPRQRELATWILTRPTPVSTSVIGQRFGITARVVRGHINENVRRIENGHRAVREAVQAAA